MEDKKFAFESEGEVSIAFTLVHGLGDMIVAKKVLTAVIELAPNCIVDIFGIAEHRKGAVKLLYSDIKNLNLTLLRDDSFKDIYQKYDLVFHVAGCWYVNIEYTNDQRLQKLSPSLFQAVTKIKAFNVENIQKAGFNRGAPVRFFAMAKVLNKSCYDILSCDGALPIRDNKVTIPLASEYQSKFDDLKLGNYITIYSNIGIKETRPKNKTWPVRYFVEYVDLMKKHFPAVKIVQCGGGGILRLQTPTVTSWA